MTVSLSESPTADRQLPVFFFVSTGLPPRFALCLAVNTIRQCEAACRNRDMFGAFCRNGTPLPRKSSGSRFPKDDIEPIPGIRIRSIAVAFYPPFVYC
jgi:hypothetical protein